MSIDEIKSDIYKKLNFEIKSDSLKDEIQRCVVDSTHPFLLLQWCTRSGKSRPSLKLCSVGKSLCFTPTTLLHNNHRKEAVEAKIDIPQLEFACYASSHKYVDKEYECLWLDKHLSN